MIDATMLGGAFRLGRQGPAVRRMGYGAMRLSGSNIMGPPKDRDAAIAVLREAIDAGVNHIDTSDFYGPHLVNQLIREALYPYPEDLVIVTKVGFMRPPDGSWRPAKSREELTAAVHDNLRNLGVAALGVVNLRCGGAHGPTPGSIAEQLETLIDLQRDGLIKHIGLSNVTVEQADEAHAVAEIVCVQNEYNVVSRKDDAFIDLLAARNIAYVPFFPLGGFKPLPAQPLDEIAASLGATRHQVALAWLLRRSPNIVLIPGTASVAHLRENLASTDLDLPDDVYAKLDALGGYSTA